MYKRLKRTSEEKHMFKVIVDSVTFDPSSSLYKISLKDERTGKILPIFVGAFEGNAVVIGIKKIPTVRPLTHDLTLNILEKLLARITKIIVSDLRDNVYYGQIFIDVGETEMQVDSRPSDAIALAIRANAPIYVSTKLLDRFIDEFDEILEEMEPEETVH